MNHVIIIGRLTRDPELRYTPNGIAVANFTVAVDRPYTNQAGERETDFIPVVVWQKLAETCANHLHKGRLVAVDGRLQIRSYETQDGQRRRVAEVVAANVQFLDRANEARRNVSVNEGGGETSQDQAADDFGEINLDDLPF
ncbi:MAG TPA: single-stranded DNA-binding protein [Firmicutes bacterium]|jgi:single-strand DNA-binding protein|nr:single-stranded DNA-binding protein [Bacillota bacterium]